MYGEMVFQSNPGEFAPVSESAYCGAGNLHEFFIHSRNIDGTRSDDSRSNNSSSSSVEVLEIFGGLPTKGVSLQRHNSDSDRGSEWDDVVFHQLKAPHNITISAMRKNGSTQWIGLQSWAEVELLLVRLTISMYS